MTIDEKRTDKAVGRLFVLYDGREWAARSHIFIDEIAFGIDDSGNFTIATYGNSWLEPSDALRLADWIYEWFKPRKED